MAKKSKVRRPYAEQGVFKIISGFIEDSDLCELFSTVKMTIIRWRATRKLPYWVLPGTKMQAIRFKLAEVQAWAKKQDIKPDPKVLKRLLEKSEVGRK